MYYNRYMRIGIGLFKSRNHDTFQPYDKIIGPFPIHEVDSFSFVDGEVRQNVGGKQVGIISMLNGNFIPNWPQEKEQYEKFVIFTTGDQ